MSKEQTPITAEDLFSDIWEMINNDANTFSQLCISARTILDIEDKIEKAFNAKVSEAIESFIYWCYAEEGHYKSKEELINAFLNRSKTKV